ncbi:MAG: phosphoheptose isomerase [Candidatus Aenigmatarchaeota archaeon]|nr:MAG: phosphoheptose isomerase [Candidatus Aenigmarchaeota archaeon]
MQNLETPKTNDGKNMGSKMREGLTNHLIDIDGVVCEDIPNEEPERMKSAYEIPGVKDKINKWYDNRNILAFFTSRTDVQREVTIEGLKEHGFKYPNIMFNKPRGGNCHYMDNRYIKSTKFNGDFKEIY